MPYLHEFGKDNILINRMETHPEYSFTLYSGSAYINNDRNLGQNIKDGYLSLYEYNVDRQNTDAPGANKINSMLITPYVIKDGNWLAFQSTTTGSYITEQPGAIISSSSPFTSSLRREYFPARAWPFPDGTAINKTEYVNNRKNLLALQNTMNYYKYLNYNYYFTGSYMSGIVNMVQVPSIFYGSSISRGSVSLKFYFTGTLVDEATDSRQNGELISTKGSLSGNACTMVLYNEGINLITS